MVGLHRWSRGACGYLELFGPLGSLEADDDVAHGLAIAVGGVRVGVGGGVEKVSNKARLFPIRELGSAQAAGITYPPIGFSVSVGVSSVTSPSYTSFTSFILRPIALRKFSIRTSVGLTSAL